MNEKHISYQHKAPYYTLNELTSTTKRVWLVFHGYGQLSKFFLRNFMLLDKRENFVMAPQGLSKYYLQGFEGRVGANWMTKEDRMTDIANQYAYIDQVLDDAQLDWERLELVYFGFSQGVATMGRYAAYSMHSFAQMILWAGTFPPELSHGDFQFLSGKEKFQYFVGSKDPFFSPTIEEEQQKLLSEVFDQHISVTKFEGAHELKTGLIQML